MASSSEDEETRSEMLRAQKERHGRRAADAAVRQLAVQAHQALANSDHYRAIQHFTEALAMRPHDADLLSGRATACARQGLYVAALHDGELLAKALPDFHRGHSICGSALFCMGRYEESARAYQQALALAAASPEAAGLRDALADAALKVDERLRRAIITGEEGELARILHVGVVDINRADDKHGWAYLHLAAATGRATAAEALLGAGADPAASDAYGKLPLHWAAAAGHGNVADLLVAAGGSNLLLATDRSGWDPLMAACNGGHHKLVSAWIGEADLSFAAPDGSTYLHAAARNGDTALIRGLVAAGASVDACDGKGRSSLEIARGAGHEAAAVLLGELAAPGARAML